MGERGGTSPWVWVGVGCLAVVVLVVIAVAGISYFGYKTFKQLEAELEDPQAREDAALEVLGAQRLPEGYHAMFTVSVPLLVKLAVLSDRPPDEEGKVDGFDRHGFIYMNAIQSDQDRDELRDYFEGRSDDPEVLRKNRIRLRTREVIERGSFDLDGATMLHLTSRGEVIVAESDAKGLMALVLVQCPGDSRNRIGIWFGPDPDPETPSDQLDLTGTPADEAAIRSFMGHFQLCPS